MQIDVPTLYYLIVGTTFVASCLTFWERRFNRPHRHELGQWALGYLLIAIGCLLRITEPLLPPFVTIGISNLAVCLGYFFVAFGVARFLDLAVPRWVPSVLAALSLAWLTIGYWQAMPSRIVTTSTVTGALCAWAAIALLRRRMGVRPLPSQSLAGALCAVHAAFFLVRALVTMVDLGAPIAFWGTNIMLTMFEGILWSAAAPMTLLVLVREKTESRLVAVSQTDHLTALDNRRAFFDKGERLLARSEQAGTGAVLLAFDLDHFKSINDRFGHGAGDDVLRLFAQVAREIVGPDALLARLGGEEFAAILPGSDVEACHRLAARIGAQFSARAADRNGLAIPVTVSIGLAATGPSSAELGSLLAGADRALYRAKALGRNRIERACPIVAAAAA